MKKSKETAARLERFVALIKIIKNVLIITGANWAACVKKTRERRSNFFIKKFEFSPGRNQFFPPEKTGRGLENKNVFCNLGQYFFFDLPPVPIKMI